LSGGGVVGFTGTTTEEAAVTVAGQAAQTSQVGTRFEKVVVLPAGTNTVTVAAFDPSGNTNSKNYRVVVVGGSGQSFTYDANGNMTSDGVRTYAWDAENRLIKIAEGTKTTDIEYDGFHHWTRILEKNGATTVSDRRFIWYGNTLVEQRNGTSTTAAQRYLPQGVQQGTSKFFYTRDHLGSVREVVNNSGSIVARYDYDPYGRRTKLSGAFDSDFGFTGHYYHVPSGLHFAPFRAYSAELGRWISRDPIGESGGINLYGYVAASPVSMWDPLGLEASLVLHRDCDSRDSPGTLYIFEDGVYLGSVRANTTGYIEGTTGVRPGHYDVLPKNNYEPGDAWLDGQPSVTDPRYPDQPGKAGPTYKPTVRIHPEGPSRGCITVPRDVDPLIRDLMMRNLDRGGTTLDVYHPQGSPRAKPTR
jgi:RHS repeat-associated protein